MMHVMVRGRPLVLIVLAALVALPPLAFSSPPDPIWIGGVYDAADYDDAVLAVTSTASVVEDSPLMAIEPFSLMLAVVLLSDATVPSLAFFPAFQVRAPPLP